VRQAYPGPGTGEMRAHGRRLTRRQFVGVGAVAVLAAALGCRSDAAPQVPEPQLFLTPDVAIDLVEVPAGEFLMGSTARDRMALENEVPQHTVSLDAYRIGLHEVTVAQFRAFVTATGYRTTAELEGGGLVHVVRDSTRVVLPGAYWVYPLGPGNRAEDDHPVTQVSWHDAVAFCRWASDETGRDVGLPTEAEWEKAARGSDGRLYPWGNTPVAGDLANLADRNLPVEWADAALDDGQAFTAPVGSYPSGASPYGALDMAGNVCEWTHSLHAPYPYDPDDGREDPRHPGARVRRGGGFGSTAAVVRVAGRRANPPAYRADYLGFRVCVHPYAGP
jgi:formylglycine-generating enzyme required for sulfatase activity